MAAVRLVAIRIRVSYISSLNHQSCRKRCVRLLGRVRHNNIRHIEPAAAGILLGKCDRAERIRILMQGVVRNGADLRCSRRGCHGKIALSETNGAHSSSAGEWPAKRLQLCVDRRSSHLCRDF
jgi:hypothetical protein